MIAAGELVLRPWARGDIESLVRYAGNRKIWLNLRDRFPHPYTRADAESWVALAHSAQAGALHLAIELQGVAIGGVGFDALPDVGRICAEIGYWLAEPFWGRGFATLALGAMTVHAFERVPLERLQAFVFGWNPASARVLEKCGYRFEGRMRRAVIKDGRVGDALMYARLKGE